MTSPIRPHQRLLLYVLLCSPLLLAGASLLWALLQGSRPAAAGSWVLLALATLVLLVNLHLRWLRPWLHQRRQGDPDALRRVSGLPVLGSLQAGVAILLAWGNLPVAVLALILLLLDPDGTPQLLLLIRRQRLLE